MAQRPGRSWDEFIPSSSIFNTLNSPGVSATLSSSNNGHGHFTSANSNSFPGQGNHAIGSGPHDHLQAPFSISPINGTSTVEHQSKALLELLLQELKDGTPMKQEIQDSIVNKVRPELKKAIREDTQEEFKDLTEQITQLKNRIKELEAGYKAIGNQIWKHLMEYLQQQPFVLMPYPIDKNKTPQ